MKRVLIIPGSADCNRGDQALVWTAIDLIRDTYGDDTHIGLLADADDPATAPESRQTSRRGFPFCKAILENPNRCLKGEGGMTHTSRWNYFRVAVRALLDGAWSALLLSLAPYPRLARRLLSPAKRETYEQFRQCDLAVIKGGAFIYAFRKVMYYYFLWYLLYHIMLAQRLGIPVVVLPNSFGPLETRFSRWLSRRVLKRCSVVTTREHQSQKVVEQLVPGKARQYPDMAFTLKIDESLRCWARQELERFGVDTGGNAIGITMRPWRFPDHPNPAQGYRNYVSSMAEFIRSIKANGRQPVLFVHVQGPGKHEMDRLALEDCLAEFPSGQAPILVDGPYDCRQIKAMYSHMHAMVGTRFHSCIFALSQAIPTVAIGYQGHKASGIMSDIGLAEYSLHINELSSESLQEALGRLLDNQASVKDSCRAYMQHIDGALSALKHELPELKDKVQ